jgi:hypothetical protein
MSVPNEYLGVWKRTLLRTPQFEDTASRVYWLQTRDYHADIRIPADRPSCTGKSSLDQLTRAELMGLAKQQGFAGITIVEADICRWLRSADYQPPTGGNDIGRMMFTTPDRVFEYGVEADYVELWERLPDSAGENYAIDSGDESGASFEVPALLVAGKYFMHVRPRAMDLPKAASLTALAEKKSNAELHELLDFEIAFGVREGEGIGRVELSTLPWREGVSLSITV